MLNLELGDLLKRNMILTGNRHKGGVYEFACILGKVGQDCSIISRGPRPSFVFQSNSHRSSNIEMFQ